MARALTKIRDWYARFERPISSLSLVGGFICDAVALKRVDFFWENFWVIVHILIVAIFIVLLNLQENEAMDEKDATRRHFWYINILQFFFGGLFSTFLVFYFKSGTILIAWPFLLMLLAAFIANESLKGHYARIVFQIALFYLSILSFAIFIVPIFFHRIGRDIFLISDAASLIVLGIFLLTLWLFAKEKFKKSKYALIYAVAGIFFLVNILYFGNLIPPIPLSLKDAGMYHSLFRDNMGNYQVENEDQGRFAFFTLIPKIHLRLGEPLFAFSAIFSPTSFDTNIIHEWQKYDKNVGGWRTQSKINLSAVGGRDAGYRTYSMKNNLSAGKWRVNVETSDGQIIGRLRFDVIFVDSEPALIKETKN